MSDFNYGAYISRFDTATAQGQRDLLATAVEDWRGDRLNDLQMDDVLGHLVGSMTGAALAPSPDAPPELAIPVRTDIENAPHGARVVAVFKPEANNGHSHRNAPFIGIIDRSCELYDEPVIDVTLGGSINGYGAAHDLSDIAAWAPVYAKDKPQS